MTPNRFFASAGRLGDFLLFPSGGMITVTPNRTSASAGRLGGAFPSRRDDYRDPEPGFRIGGAVGGVFSFPSRGNCCRDPEPDFRISGAVGGVCCFFLPGDDYRDPEPGFRIGGAVGVFAFALRGEFCRDPEPDFRIGGSVGVFFAFPSGENFTVTPNRTSASAGRLGCLLFFPFWGYLLRGGITASPAFGRPWRRPFRPFCASAPPAGF